MSIPIILLCRIQIGLRRKLVSAAFISLSSLTLSISVIRIGLATLPNQVTDTVWVIFWTLIEAGIAIIIVSVTAFRSLFCQDGAMATNGSHKPTGGCPGDVETASQAPSRLSCFLNMSRKSHSCEELPHTNTISHPRPQSRHDRYDRLNSAVSSDPEIAKPARVSVASRVSVAPHAITTDIPHPHPLGSAPRTRPSSIRSCAEMTTVKTRMPSSSSLRAQCPRLPSLTRRPRPTTRSPSCTTPRPYRGTPPSVAPAGALLP